MTQLKILVCLVLLGNTLLATAEAEKWLRRIYYASNTCAVSEKQTVYIPFEAMDVCYQTAPSTSQKRTWASSNMSTYYYPSADCTVPSGTTVTPGVDVRSGCTAGSPMYSTFTLDSGLPALESGWGQRCYYGSGTCATGKHQCIQFKLDTCMKVSSTSSAKWSMNTTTGADGGQVVQTMYTTSDCSGTAGNPSDFGSTSCQKTGDYASNKIVFYTAPDSNASVKTTSSYFSMTFVLLSVLISLRMAI